MGDSINVTTQVAFRRWKAPNFATMESRPRARQDGIQAMPSTPVRELAPDVLDALAAAWIHDLYAKAGREAPVVGPALAAARNLP